MGHTMMYFIDAMLVGAGLCIGWHFAKWVGGVASAFVAAFIREIKGEER